MSALRVPPILRFVALRLLLALPALWLIVTMVFLLVHIVPGDPVAQMLGEGARAEDLEQLRHALNLDQPIRLQYLHYITGVVRGDLGQSFRFQQPVAQSDRSNTIQPRSSFPSSRSPSAL